MTPSRPSEEAQAGSYQLIITDHRMPEMSGIELLGRVRAKKIPTA